MNKILLLSVLALFTLPTFSQNIFEPDKVTHYLAGSSVSMGTYLVLDRYEIKRNKKITVAISVGILDYLKEYMINQKVVSLIPTIY